MQVLSVFGGPRKRGNTATVLGWVEEALQGQGHAVERVNLASLRINGCLGCGKCKQNPSAPGCIQHDDGPAIFERMVASDLVLYATPLYYWGFSAQMKAFVDRGFCLHRGECGGIDHTAFTAGQRQALIVTAADPYENNAELIQTSFQRALVYQKAVSAGELFVCNTTAPDALGEEIRQQAQRFARQLPATDTRPYAVLLPGGAPSLVPRVAAADRR